MPYPSSRSPIKVPRNDAIPYLLRVNVEGYTQCRDEGHGGSYHSKRDAFRRLYIQTMITRVFF